MPTHEELPTEWLDGPARKESGEIAPRASPVRRPTVTTAEVGVVAFITAVLGFMLGQSL